MIRIVRAYSDIVDVLNVYSPYLESLRNGRVNSVEIAKKFMTYGTVLEYCDANKRIGFCSFYHNDRQGRKAYLSMIAVSTEYEGMGYASQLLDKVEEISKKSNMSCILLEVKNDNDRAIRFYQRHGYDIIDCASSHSILMMKNLITL